MREALALAGAEQHDVRAEVGERGEILLVQMLEVGSAPGFDFARGDDDARIAARAVHHHVVVAVSGDRVGGAGGGSVKVHATILQCVNFQGLSGFRPTSSTSPTS